MEVPLWLHLTATIAAGTATKSVSNPIGLSLNHACGSPQRKEKEHMEKQNYQMDFSFLEDYDNSTTHYQPFDLLASPKCVPMMVMCSKKPEPAAWSIIGVMYSVHFLHYKDMEDYITSHGLTRWTDEHDRKSGLCLCGISNHCRIF